jgi:hypothetical protein
MDYALAGDNDRRLIGRHRRHGLGCGERRDEHDKKEHDETHGYTRAWTEWQAVVLRHMTQYSVSSAPTYNLPDESKLDREIL